MELQHNKANFEAINFVYFCCRWLTVNVININIFFQNKNSKKLFTKLFLLDQAMSKFNLKKIDKKSNGR